MFNMNCIFGHFKLGLVICMSMMWEVKRVAITIGVVVGIMGIDVQQWLSVMVGVAVVINGNGGCWW